MSSPFPCVRSEPGGFRAVWARKDGHKVNLGLFTDPEIARAAVLLARAQHHEDIAQRCRDEAQALIRGEHHGDSLL
jgi:hypothetical protein